MAAELSGSLGKAANLLGLPPVPRKQPGKAWPLPCPLIPASRCRSQARPRSHGTVPVPGGGGGGARGARFGEDRGDGRGSPSPGCGVWLCLDFPACGLGSAPCWCDRNAMRVDARVILCLLAPNRRQEGGLGAPSPPKPSSGRGSGCAAGAGMQGSSRGWFSPCVAEQGDPTASPSLSFKDILFCPRQRALFGLQPCQRLLTPSLALLAQPGSARPGGRTAQVGSCHRLSQPGRAPLAPCSQGLQSLEGGPALSQTPPAARCRRPRAGGPAARAGAAEAALGCGSPSRNNKGQRWGGPAGDFSA